MRIKQNDWLSSVNLITIDKFHTNFAILLHGELAAYAISLTQDVINTFVDKHVLLLHANMHITINERTQVS